MKDYEFAKGKTGRTIFVRVKAGADLVRCMKEAFEESGFLVASVSFGIGSLKNVCFTFVDKEGKYSPPVKISGRFELISMNGFLSRVSGKTEIHIHSAFSDNNGRLFGGHLLENGNIIYATAEVRLDELVDIKIAKMYDKQTKFDMFKVFKEQE